MTTQIGTDITQAAQLLQANEIVAIPTETVYGLAGNALQTEAVVKIFEAKNRPFFNPLIIHVTNVEQISLYANIDDVSLQLAQHFMPGALTLLLPKKNIVPDMVTAGSNKVAIRIPNHALTLQLLQSIDFPLAAPSANAFGYVSPVTAQHVWQGLQNKISYILDGGKCNVGLESTIVEILNDEILIHRVGGVAVEDIEKISGKKIVFANNEKEPQTSGQLKSHYATTTPLLQGNVEELYQQYNTKKIAIISLSTVYPVVEKEHQYILSATNNLSEAAQNLFTTMRLLDEQNYDIILAEIFPDEGLGKAINDRLQRAQVSAKE